MADHAGMIQVPLDAFLEISLRLPRLSPLPPLDGSLTGWPDDALLPDLSALHGQSAFARAWAGWSIDGLALAFDVHATHQLQIAPDRPFQSEGVEIWVDTRDARAARKPTRFCHHFVVLPGGQGPGGRQPLVTELNPGGVKKTEDMSDLRHVRAAARTQPGTGYRLEVLLGREALVGYSPLESPSIGLAYRVRSTVAGLQDLAFGERFPIWRNPSLWRSAKLEGAGG